MVICLLFSLSALVFLVFASVHLWRADNANRINADYWIYKDFVSQYDSCSTPGIVRQVDPTVDQATVLRI